MSSNVSVSTASEKSFIINHHPVTYNELLFNSQEIGDGYTFHAKHEEKKSTSKFAMQASHFMAQPIITTLTEEIKHHIIVTIMANCNSNQRYIVQVYHNRFMIVFFFNTPSSLFIIITELQLTHSWQTIKVLFQFLFVQDFYPSAAFLRTWKSNMFTVTQETCMQKYICTLF